MANTGDILVCQVGNNANFIGSHLWNTREEDDSYTSKLYHSGNTKRYPRCVMIDSPDNLGQLSTENVSARGVTDSIWGGSIQTSVNVRQTEAESIVEKDPSFYSRCVPRDAYLCLLLKVNEVTDLIRRQQWRAVLD